MSDNQGAYRILTWRDGALEMIDQRLLPGEVRYVTYTEYRAVAEAIRTMVVRGAPAIGVAAAYGMALAALHSSATNADTLRRELADAAGVLRASRPTAVNLFWAIDRILDRVGQTDADAEAIRAAALDEARAIETDNARTCEQIGRNALSLVPDHARIIHHCNTGALATAHYGTALGVVRAAHEAGKGPHVFVDETRPRLQGARLTTWELGQLGIPHTLIVDGASGHIMRTLGVDLCVVGCDRVAANGDTANKIGTYNLALIARAHGVPFYVAGPLSTLDLALPNGDAIPIEERDPDEVTHIGMESLTPAGVGVANPAFDVTPAHLITAIITEVGIAYPPYEESLARLMSEAKGQPTAK
ncbi:MAG: Methylthioribose-1-phosphate isomerase [uncultured Thermomicrobiales bacterium]|uniref:Methylthioribose-1-phosphate isomerase n=1 Tax=uncultured Thermomicrobiales bacterium TaxID=1645740 RepID=A0A6J4UT91_9BACT|nr:MAG: Methylthioribose-1-phosphate isomerase [uncultured Thermomicrobiales bacterium]